MALCDSGGGMNDDVARPSSIGYGHPAAVIAHTVWVYFRHWWGAVARDRNVLAWPRRGDAAAMQFFRGR